MLNPLRISVLAAYFIAGSLAAESVVCRGETITVQDFGARAKSICEAAIEVTGQLANCNLTVDRPVTIKMAEDMADNCYGLYDCDEGLIQLRPLEDFADYLSSHPNSPFSHLDPVVLFTSVLRHELAHAALFGTPCPYDNCPVSREFVAYTMQIRFLSEADRAPFDKHINDAQRPITKDDVSALALMMAPEAFIKNAYVYLSQQDDPCALIDAIAKGDVVLDLPFR